jgi:hypothetical protein
MALSGRLVSYKIFSSPQQISGFRLVSRGVIRTRRSLDLSNAALTMHGLTDRSLTPQSGVFIDLFYVMLLSPRAFRQKVRRCFNHVSSSGAAFLRQEYLVRLGAHLENRLA